MRSRECLSSGCVVPLAVLSPLLSLQLPYTQRHLGDALTKRVPNECGKWEYQFDELCYSISAINFPVAPLSKMESRMIEPLFRYLIFRQLPVCICVWVCVWCWVWEKQWGREIFFRGASFCLWAEKEIVFLLVHRTRLVFALSLLS